MSTNGLRMQSTQSIAIVMLVSLFDQQALLNANKNELNPEINPQHQMGHEQGLPDSPVSIIIPEINVIIPVICMGIHVIIVRTVGGIVTC